MSAWKNFIISFISKFKFLWTNMKILQKFIKIMFLLKIFSKIYKSYHIIYAFEIKTLLNIYSVFDKQNINLL